MSIYQCDYELADKIKPGITTLRLVLGAMVAASVVFLSIACGLRLVGTFGPITVTAGLLRWVAVGLAPIAFLASRALSAFQIECARRQLATGAFVSRPDADAANAPGYLAELGDAGTLFNVYTTQAIIAAGCLELSTLACIAAFMFTGSLASLAISLALICAIVAVCPFSARGVADWIEEQLRLVDEEKTRIR